MNNHWRNVRSNQLNNSSSKSTFAFSKETRFRSQSKIGCDSFYNIPSSIGKSPACGMGSGSKKNILGNLETPSPQKYNLKSCFSTTAKGGKFSLGRQNIKHNGIFQKSETPQPGRYTIRDTLDHRGTRIHSKLKTLEPTYVKTPGPGTYSSLSTLNKTGRYIVSNVPNCSAPKIMKTKQYEVKKMVPGPGHYDQDKQNINQNGAYFNSKHQNSQCRSFAKSGKNSLSDSYHIKIPGPGTYNFFSEFGAKG